MKKSHLFMYLKINLSEYSNQIYLILSLFFSSPLIIELNVLETKEIYLHAEKKMLIINYAQKCGL